MEKFDKIKYNSEYNKKAYEQINIRVKKGQKEVIEKHSKTKGYSNISTYVKDLIDADMKQNTNPENTINIFKDEMEPFA